MRQIWRVVALGSILIVGICSDCSAQEKMTLDDRLRLAVFRYQMHHIATPWVCLSLGGTWAEGHGRSVVLHQGPTRIPAFAVVRLSLRQGPSAVHGVPVRLVGDGPDLRPHGSVVLSVAALRWVNSSHAIAYGTVHYFEPAGSGGEGNITFYAYRLSCDASGWKVITAKSVTGFG